jgi:hypothetical protein
VADTVDVVANLPRLKSFIDNMGVFSSNSKKNLSHHIEYLDTCMEY